MAELAHDSDSYALSELEHQILMESPRIDELQEIRVRMFVRNWFFERSCKEKAKDRKPAQVFFQPRHPRMA